MKEESSERRKKVVNEGRKVESKNLESIFASHFDTLYKADFVISIVISN